MSLMQKIKKRLMSTPKGKLTFYRLRRIRERFALNKSSDFEYVTATYRERFGREINLAEPKAYTEKLQWIKLFYHDPTVQVCTDKYEVRGYLEKLGYGEMLNECYGVFDNANDIDFDALPNSFVAKAAHGSSWNLICKDKSKLDIKTWRKIMNQWLKLNLYVFGREWNYKELKPRIIIEKFLPQEPLIDYKFMCFNGEPKFMQINNDFEGKHFVDFYDVDWKLAGFTYQKYHTSPDHKLDRPEGFEQMKELARQLAAPFPFVRVDFYHFDGKTIFGELTFFPGGGLLPIVPDGEKYDNLLGSWLTLPEPNYNLELLRKIKEG